MGSQKFASPATDATPEVDSQEMDAPAMDGLDKFNKVELTGSDSLILEESQKLEISKYKEVATALPDIRKERIAELRRQIESGEYRIDSQAIAEKILNRHLSEDSF